MRVTGGHSNHRPEICRHLALAASIIAKTHQAAICLQGASVIKTGGHSNHRPKICRHLALAASIIAKAHQAAIFLQGASVISTSGNAQAVPTGWRQC